MKGLRRGRPSQTEVDDFCYTGSVIDIGGSEKDMKTRIWKANAVSWKIDTV